MKKALEAIRKYKKFLITAHVNLEGDSIGSQLAMKALLGGLGKSAFILDSDPVPEHYRFLPDVDNVLNDVDKDRDFEAAIVLDCPTLKRTGRVADLISKKRPIVNIDHHISNEHFGDINWIDPKASSTGEMVYKLFKEAKVPLTREVALALYIAILTDTGSFNYDNTSSLTHEIAGDLLEHGIEPASISEKVYERRTAADIRLLGLVLSSLTLNNSGEVASLRITRGMLEDTRADASRAEGFVNYAKSIDSVKVALLFREEPNNNDSINVSFRSKGSVDVNRIAASFGGGGHVKASGCVIKGALEDVEGKVLAEVEKTLEKSKGKSEKEEPRGKSQKF